MHESDISDCDGVAIPNSLSNCTTKPVDIPLAKLSGITCSKLCELQAEDDSLKRARELAKDSKEGCLYKDGVLMSTLIDHGVKRKVVVGERAKRARHYQGCTNSS